MSDKKPKLPFIGKGAMANMVSQARYKDMKLQESAMERDKKARNSTSRF